MDSFATEDLEVALQLLGEMDAVAVVQVLDVDRIRRQAFAGAAIGLGGQRVRKVGYKGGRARACVTERLDQRAVMRGRRAPELRVGEL